MVKKEQTKIKSRLLRECNHSVPFSTTVIPLFTTQILARLKTKHKKSTNLYSGRGHVIPLKKNFI